MRNASLSDGFARVCEVRVRERGGEEVSLVEVCDCGGLAMEDSETVYVYVM